MGKETQASQHYQRFDGQYIAGAWRKGGAGVVAADTNPYNDAVLAEIHLADAQDVDLAYGAAKAAQREWAQTLPSEKSAVFLRACDIMAARRDEVINWLIAESGSTRFKANIEFDAVCDGMREASSIPYSIHGQILPVDRRGKEARVYRKPLGVIGVISPWNFPMHLSNRSVAPALATGNAVVLKPASDTPVTGGLLLAKIYEEAGLPPGVLNVIIGSGKEIGDVVARHPIPRFISFTGSTEVGMRIAQMAAASSSLKRLGLELGGNAPLVVLDDADIEIAVRSAIIGRFMHQGQICMSANRIIVEDGIYSRFLEAYRAAAAQIKYGDPAQADTLVGPLCNDAQVRSVRSCIKLAQDAGYKCELSNTIEGRVVPPHIFSGVPNSSPLAQTEIFGPVSPVICASTEAEALVMANDTPFGLSSSVISTNETRALRFASGIEAGMTHINDFPNHDFPHVMFGGEKNSGLGRFNGHWIVDELTTDHLITIQR